MPEVGLTIKFNAGHSGEEIRLNQGKRSLGSDFESLVCFCQINFDPGSLLKQIYSRTYVLSICIILVRNHSRNLVSVNITRQKHTILVICAQLSHYEIFK